MATAQFIHDGNSIDHTPSADVGAGDVVVQNDLVGVAKLDIPAGTLGALSVTGVFDVPKATGGGTAIDTGVTLYWHTDVKQANTTAAGGKLIGKSTRAAGDSDSTVRVRLSQ